ncbi:hypothetical protein CUN63_03130 [Pseudomonas sp. ACM7]|nr:7-cyano-7-deazaguanine synthase [Pseudomonas sp. ACM7]QAY88996.1 hypothetical protein CUN63_03130 [Pseudomonas sp. ACM7]
MTRKAVIVFSGGQDSTTCLIHALPMYDEIHCITFTGLAYISEIVILLHMLEKYSKQLKTFLSLSGCK